MTDKLRGEVQHFKERRSRIFLLCLILAQVVGAVAIVEVVGTVPLWRLAATTFAISVWSLSLVEMNYRLGDARER